MSTYIPTEPSNTLSALILNDSFTYLSTSSTSPLSKHNDFIEFWQIRTQVFTIYIYILTYKNSYNYLGTLKFIPRYRYRQLSAKTSLIQFIKHISNQDFAFF